MLVKQTEKNREKNTEKSFEEGILHQDVLFDNPGSYG